MFLSHKPALLRSLRLGACCVAILMFGTAGVCAAKSANLFPAPVYVTLQASNAVENLPSGKVFDGLPDAHYDAISPDGSRLLVSSATLPEAWLVDARNGEKLGTFEIGPTPQGVAISPDGRWGLAVSAGGDSVAVIDIKQAKLVKSIAVGKTPHNIRFTANGKLAYVTLQGAGAIAVIDMQMLAKIGEFPVPGLPHPHNLDLSANGKTLWIRGLVAKVAAVDLATHKVLAVIPVGLGHAGIDVIPGGRYVVTGAVADHVVDVIDPKTFKVIQRIDVGQGPHGVRASRNGRWVYAGVTATDKLAVIDTRTWKVVEQISTHGKLPFWPTVAGND
ncbi:MAG TPA: cytochrome D1 domain-containing protein [Rhodanobacteraceae bacterium]|nr:cytochrome D1 domain-containing protein [Rhodanobacteraceae bacterium]